MSSDPPKISMTQHASFPLGWTPLDLPHYILHTHLGLIVRPNLCQAPTPTNGDQMIIFIHHTMGEKNDDDFK